MVVFDIQDDHGQIHSTYTTINARCMREKRAGGGALRLLDHSSADSGAIEKENPAP